MRSFEGRHWIAAVALRAPGLGGVLAVDLCRVVRVLSGVEGIGEVGIGVQRSGLRLLNGLIEPLGGIDRTPELHEGFDARLTYGRSDSTGGGLSCR